VEDVMTSDESTRAAWKAVEHLFSLRDTTSAINFEIRRDIIPATEIVDFELEVTRWLIEQRVRIACEAWDATGREGRSEAFYRALYFEVVENVIELRLLDSTRKGSKKKWRPDAMRGYNLCLLMMKSDWRLELEYRAVRAKARAEIGAPPDNIEKSIPCFKRDREIAVEALRKRILGLRAGRTGRKLPDAPAPTEVRVNSSSGPSATSASGAPRDNASLDGGDQIPSSPIGKEVSERLQLGRKGVDRRFRNAAGEVFNRISAESPNGRLNSDGWLMFADEMDQRFAPPALYLNKNAQEVLGGAKYASIGTWKELMTKGPGTIVRSFKRRVYEYALDVRK
jgi:hypothetical protein